MGVTVSRPRFGWAADPGWPLADRLHFSEEFRVGRMVAGDLAAGFYAGTFREAARVHGRTQAEVRAAVAGYAGWLARVAGEVAR